MNMIRRAQTCDLQGMMKLLGQVLLIHHNGRPDLFKEKGSKYTMEELGELIKDDNNPIFVCLDEDGTVLGHMFCQTFEHAEGPATYEYKTLYIDDLCVDEEARGKHVGKSLYEYVKTYAKENGYYNITLHAWECNPNAYAFYRHLGMEIQQYTLEEVL